MKTFAGQRADRADSAQAWSVEEMLRELLAQIESGGWKPTSALLVWRESGADGEYVDHGWWAAKVNSELRLWMLETAKLEGLLSKAKL